VVVAVGVVMRRDHPAMLIGLRAQIDALDKHILQLLAERFVCVEQLAPLKNAENLFDEERHQQVLDGRVRWAEELNLDPNFARHIFQLVMQHSVAVQKQFWEKRQ
jgi:chorismate mutase